MSEKGAVAIDAMGDWVEEEIESVLSRGLDRLQAELEQLPPLIRSLVSDQLFKISAKAIDAIGDRAESKIEEALAKLFGVTLRAPQVAVPENPTSDEAAQDGKPGDNGRPGDFSFGT
jgi:hypothetical protein